MAKGAVRAGLAVMLAAWFSLEAPAQPARSPQAERARAERARVNARAAEAEIAALGKRQTEANARRAQAQAVDAAAATRIAALDEEAERDRAAYARDRQLLERFAAAAILADRTRPFHRPSAQMEAFVRAAGPALASQTRNGAQALAENRRLGAELSEARRLLAEAQTAIDAERRGIGALAAYERGARRVQLAAAGAADRRARRLAREARTLRELAQRVQPRASARAARPLGDLLAPAQGRLVRGYGQPTPAGRAATGLTYRTAPGADVAAPASGTVSYAGLFRSYGQILILNLDNDYVLVLAGMESVRARAGELVAAGQSIGRMPAMPAPELYVEVRRDGRPIDPSRQLASQEQRGAAGRAG